jgi:hypothetical protein
MTTRGCKKLYLKHIYRLHQVNIEVYTHQWQCSSVLLKSTQLRQSEQIEIFKLIRKIDRKYGFFPSA